MSFLLTLLLQVGVILLVSRAVGLLFRKIQQPQVVGEMAAGICLGPSLLGWAAPEVSAAVFPAESLVHLNTLSQAGLVLFMFLVGLEFDPKLMSGRGHAALVTSHVSIIAPFLLGASLALYLYPRLSDASVSFDGFALFMGAAMSVTAFPVLARILQERNLMGTKVGALTIACAAVDDVTAWAILAVVVAIVRAHALHTPLWLTLVGSAVYILLMLFVVRPLLGTLESRFARAGRITHDLLAVVLLVVLASAWSTEWLGIHALFGAFCVGAVMPKERRFVHELSDKLEHVTVVFLLPLFFANAGLRTQIGLVSGPEMWGFFGLIMLVAIAGKFGGSTLAARVTGLSWREAGALGVLMNTRGLMELVILTIGLELGVISPALFAMMVMMALLTTFMTTPILERLYPIHEMREQEELGAARPFTALVPVSLPASGPGLLRVALALASRPDAVRVYGVHLKTGIDQGVADFESTEPAQERALTPMLESATSRGVEVRPLVFASRNAGRDVADLARVKHADLVVMGWHKPVLSNRILGGAVYDVMTQAPADVAVYVERKFEPWTRVLVPYRDPAHDDAALAAAGRIGAAMGIPVTVLHIVEGKAVEGRAVEGKAVEGNAAEANEVDGNQELGAAVTDLVSRVKETAGAQADVEIKVVRSADPLAALVEHVRSAQHDLVVIGVARTWGLTPSFIGLRHERLARETNANLLILRKHEAPATAAARAPATVAVSPAHVG